MEKLKRKGNVWNWTQFHKWKERDPSKINHTPIIGKGKKVFGMGSCFAENVVKYLSTKGVEGSFFPGGTRFYDIKCVEQALMHLFEKEQYTKDDMWQTENGEYGHPFRAPGKRYKSLDELWKEDQKINEEAKNLFVNADLIVVTLGGTETWRHPKSKSTYTTIPFPDVFNSQMPGIAEYHNLTFKENYDALEHIVQMVKKHNKKEAKIIFTVSPNRMTFTVSDKDVVQATCQGKGTLRAAAGEITDKFKNETIYFHSYEVLEYSEYPELVYDDQFRHVSAFGVQVVMNDFGHFYGDESIRDEEEYHKIRKAYRDKQESSKIPEYAMAMKSNMAKVTFKQKVKKAINFLR